MGSYVETGWSVPKRETLYITVPRELASELQAVAERARSSTAAVIVDAISDANEFGWTASRQALAMPPGGVAKQISLDPKVREDLALVAAMVVYYLREKLGESGEASAASES